MNLVFSPQAWADYLYWQTTDPKMLRRVNELIRDASRSPFEGIGKPEALRHALQGFWSRRISEEHRMVYRVTAQGLEIAQLRYHYES
jgi:toxin YoeB